MAITHKYVHRDGPLGTGDGSSEANAWSLATALTSATGDMCVWIKWDSDEYDLSAGDSVDGTGDLSENQWLRFIGYYDISKCTLGDNPSQVKSDMELGGDSYQSPLDAYVNGIDVAGHKCVGFDGGNIAGYIIGITSKQNIEFRSIYFHDTSGATGYAITAVGTPLSLILRNCRFADVERVFTTYAERLYIANCFVKGDCRDGLIYQSSTAEQTTVLHNNVIAQIADKFIIRVNAGSLFATGNIFIGGHKQVVLIGARLGVLHHNVFYDYLFTGTPADSCGITTAGISDAVIEFSNIFCPTTKECKAVIQGYTGGYAEKGSIFYTDYSLAYSLDGDALTSDPWYDYKNACDIQGPNSLKNVNPLFVDAANGDFRLQSNSPCLNTGKPTLGGP